MIKVIEALEDLENKAATNRWTALKGRAGNVTILGPGGIICVSEECLEKLLMVMKECEFKTTALSSRGHAIDETKVRQITLHAGNNQISVQVKHIDIALTMAYL